MSSETASLRRGRSQLYLASFLVDAVGHGYGLVVVEYALSELGASTSELGLLGATWPLVYAVTCLTLGKWSDRVGSMPLLRAGLICLAVVVLPLALTARSLAPLYLAAAGVGFSLAFFWPPLQRQLSIQSPGRMLWRSLGTFNIYWAAGAATGTYAALPTYHRLGFSTTIGIYIALILFSLLCSIGCGTQEKPSREREPLEEVPPMKAQLFLYLGWIANFSAAFTFGGIHYIFVYVGREYHLGVWIGAIIFAKELGRLCAFVTLRYCSGWHYSLRCLAIVQLLGGIAVIASAFVRAPALLFLLFFIAGCFIGLAYYSSFFYGLNLRSEEGKKAGIHEGILASGTFLGPLLCGAVGSLYPDWPGGVLLLPGVVIVVSLGLLLLLAAHSSRKYGFRLT